MNPKTDAETKDAIDLMKSPAAQHDPAHTATAMIAVAVGTLVYVGGRAAAVETLEGVISRIRAGHYPEPQHAAGNA